MSIFSRYCILFLLICSTLLIGSPKIELDSELSNGELVPIIKVNHTVVMRIKSKGPEYMHYPSNFARAQRIHELLVDLSGKGFDIGSIRVKRRKSEYSGEIKGLRVFTISQADLTGTGKTPYQMGKYWTENIKNAASKPTDSIVLSTVDHSEYPFLNTLNIFGSSKMIYSLIQLLLLISLQVFIAYILITKMDKKILLIKHLKSLDEKVKTLKIRQQILEDKLKQIDQASK